MRLASAIAVLLLLCSAALAGPVSIFRTTDHSGRAVDFLVPSDRLLATPQWSPEDGEPPLSVASAVRAAKQHLKPAAPGDLQVAGIILGSSLAPDDSYRWYYEVQLIDRTKLNASSPPGLESVVLLLDGSVVDPHSTGK